MSPGLQMYKPGPFYSTKTWIPSALILYIVEHVNPGLTGSEPMEAMDVDPEPLPEPTAETQDQPMETEQSEPSLGTFQPELGTPGYILSLIRSTNSPLSPIMGEDNALLDADLDVLGLSQSKAPGAGRLKGSSPKPQMTLRKRKQP